MSDFVSATFTISRNEFIRAIRRYYKTNLQTKRDLLAGVAAVLIGVYLLPGDSSPSLTWLMIIAGAILLILVGYTVVLLPHLIYRYQPKLQSEYRLRFGEDAIHFQTDEIDSELKWSIYHSWVCDHEFYILYHGKRDISVIPRRALEGEADERFARLLHKTIGPALAQR